MIKENLKRVIREFHESTLPDLIERKTSFDFSLLHAPINKVVTIIGPRRAGKTYFLFQIMKALTKKKLHITDILYINFEDERILPMREQELQYILDAYFELYEKKTHPFLSFRRSLCRTRSGSRNQGFFNWLQNFRIPEPAPDLDPGFTGVTTFYATIIL
ncbi:MAG: AAA family ATPase [Desulfobacteraceae bacterium]|jgi:hypothetical protein|nr:AAA family ATPase [Desulfobacteraceae bacterium]